MDLVRIEREHKQIARALGIEAFNRGKTCDSVLGNPEMVSLCAGYNAVMIKSLVGAFVNGWTTQNAISARPEPANGQIREVAGAP